MPKSPSEHHRTTLSGYIFATKARIDNRKKTCYISSKCPYNIVNFGPLAAEIVSLVWGTPAYFNGFRVLTAKLRRWTEGATCIRRAAITLGIGPHFWLYSYNTTIRKNLYLIMAALCNIAYSAGHYIFALWFLLLSSIYLFPRLISAVADWMFTILPHMVWP